MSTKIIETRIANKTDTTANWNATINFIPLKGEIIIYQDEDSPTRYKIGDGKTDVNNLPFLICQPNWAQTDETAPDFIKNKPAFGSLSSKDEVEKTDLSEDVQELLNKAESSVQPGNIPKEIYVGEGDMPEDATIQILMDGSDEEQALKDGLKEYIINEISKRETGIIETVKTEIPLVKTAEQPTFVNSVDEMTDTSKVYVMPDGYIYAYMTKTVTTNPTNQIKVSIESDGTLYNGGQGWKDGYRLDSSGAEVVLASYKVTGFISAKFGDTLRFANISGEAVSNTKFAFYDSSFSVLNVLLSTPVTEALTNGIYAITDNLESYGLRKSIEDMAYIRLSVSTMSDASVVTVNEPLEASTTTTQGWYSTGLAFVPADYEDRIIELENRATSLENRVDELSVGDSGTFTYVAEEAERVAEIVQSKRTVGSLTFTAMSDFHVEVDTEVKYGSYDVKDNLTSCRDAGLGLAEIQKHFKLDFAAVLGDYTWGDNAETIEQVKKDITYVKNCMVNGMKDIPNIWCTGNHDINYGAESDRRMTEDEMYAYVTSNNKGTIQDGSNIGRNYGYIDFENQKIRCIYLNTVDALDYPDNIGTNDDALEITAIQTQWLVDVGLNLNDKEDATKWGIVLLSHHCLSQFPHVTAVLTAYKDGTSGNVDVTTNGVTTNVNYDFTTTTRGEIICAIHGHDHNFKYRKISNERWDKVTEANAWLWSIGVPNVDIVRNNEKATYTDEAYKQAFGEFNSSGNPVYYPKTQGTATSTSFCVIAIDRKNRKVHAIAYGAGINREISY